MIKKTAFLYVVLLSSLIMNTSDGFASVTRTRTMGDAGMIVKDQSNYWLFPAKIAYQHNQVVFEWGGRPELIYYSSANYGFDRWAGGIFNFGKSNQKTFGAFWSEGSKSSPFELFSISGVATDHKFDLFYGNKTGFGAWALHLNHSADMTKVQRTGINENKTSVAQTQLTLGISRNNQDLSIGYRLSTFRTEGNHITGHAFDLQNRWFKPINDKLSLIPLLELKLNLENKSSTAKGHVWQIWTGTGLNYQVDEGDLLVLGISVLASGKSLKMERSGTQSGTTIFELPFVFGGIESSLFSWLKLRFGFQKALRRISQTNEFNSTSQDNANSESPFAFTAGIGLQYKRLTLDLSWDNNFLKRGPYFISGSKGDIFNLISLSYSF